MNRVLIVSPDIYVAEGIKKIIDLHYNLFEVNVYTDLQHISINDQTLILVLSSYGKKEVEMGLIKNAVTKTPFVMFLYLNIDANQVLDLIKLGVKGITSLEVSSTLLFKAIDIVLNQQYYIDDSLTTYLIKDYLHIVNVDNKYSSIISDREKEMLLLMNQGYTSNKEIAEQMHVSESTIRNHFTAIMKKLNAKDRTEMILRAIKLGLLPIN